MAINYQTFDEAHNSSCQRMLGYLNPCCEVQEEIEGDVGRKRQDDAPMLSYGFDDLA